MSDLTEQMRSMTIDKYCSHNEVGDLFTTHLCIDNQKMSNYAIKEGSSRIFIDPRDDALHLRVSGVSMAFDFDFKIWSDPEWLHDAGTGSISVFNADISLSLSLTKGSVGQLEVSYWDEKIHTRDYEVILNGETELSKAAQQMMTSFKVFFEEELTLLLANRLTTTAKQVLESKVMTNTDNSNLEDDSNQYNKLILLSNPIFDTHSVSFAFDDTFGLADDEWYDARPIESYQSMPLLLIDKESDKLTHSQQFISEQTLNFALEAIFDDNLLTMDQSVSSKVLTSLFPNFETVYGKQDEVKVSIKSTQSPLVMIGTEVSTLSGAIEMTVMNPLAVEEEYEAAIITATFSAELLFLLRIESNTLTCVLKNEAINVLSLETLFWSKIDVEKLNEVDD